MKVFIEKDNKTVNIEFNGSVKDLLKKLSVNPETVIVVKKEEIITEEDTIKNNDEIRLLSVVSGG